MISIALGVFIVFIVYVMIWSIKNDGARSIREQTGFIRMRTPPEVTAGEENGPQAQSAVGNATGTLTERPAKSRPGKSPRPGTRRHNAPR